MSRLSLDEHSRGRNSMAKSGIEAAERGMSSLSLLRNNNLGSCNITENPTARCRTSNSYRKYSPPRTLSSWIRSERVRVPVASGEEKTLLSWSDSKIQAVFAGPAIQVNLGRQYRRMIFTSRHTLPLFTIPLRMTLGADQTCLHSPMNISCVHRFCKILKGHMTDPNLTGKRIIYYTGTTPQERTNCVFLLGCYLILENQLSPKLAWKPFQRIKPSPFKQYKDATFSGGDFNLSILHCLEGLSKAISVGMYDPVFFHPELYDYYDSPRNGDLHCVVPGRFVAMKGPNKKKVPGVYSHTPREYLEVFRSLGVKAVVRLNSSEYDKDDFLFNKIEHYDLFFEDCTTPTDDIVRSFMKICDNQSGVIAVHCLAGLGRTGTLIALWLMRTHTLTVHESIAALRIMRPGSIIASQAHYLAKCQAGMWAWGEGKDWQGSDWVEAQDDKNSNQPQQCIQWAEEVKTAMIHRNGIRSQD